MKGAFLICLGLISGFSFKSTQASSICSQPRKVGFCRAAFRRFYFDSETGKCTPFIYGGCRGNENNFSTMEECQAKCYICLQPKKTGFCRAAFRKFYFDSETGKCTPFIYGGCGGNENNFETLHECQAKCMA